jgi:predicted oxidoreductase
MSPILLNRRSIRIRLSITILESRMNTLPLSRYLADASPLIYGCMGLGGGWNKEAITQEHLKQTHNIIDATLENGINIFDHADIYTLGKAEEVFGQALLERPELREMIYLQSKCAIRFEDESGPKRYDMSGEWIEQSVNNSLSRLKTDYLDLLILHRPDPLMQPEEVAQTLHALKASGKVRHFGVSNMQQHQMSLLQSCLNEPLVVNQIEMSLQQLGWLEEGVLAGNPQGKDVNFSAGTLEYCRLNSVQIQSWGSLAQGLFTGREITHEAVHIQQTAQLIASLAVEYQVSKEAIVLAWLMRHPANIQPVIGTTNIDRIKACTQASDIELTRAHWYALYVSSRGEELP